MQSGISDYTEAHSEVSKSEIANVSTARCVLPIASVFIAAGRILQFWGGAVSAVLQHVIRQVCEQFLQLRKK